MNLGQKILDDIAIKLDKSSAKGQSKDKRGRFSGGTGAAGGPGGGASKSAPNSRLSAKQKKKMEEEAAKARQRYLAETAAAEKKFGKGDVIPKGSFSKKDRAWGKSVTKSEGNDRSAERNRRRVPKKKAR